MLGRALFSSLKTAGKLTVGGGGRRMMTGTAIGGAYGAMSSDPAASPTANFESIVKGAAMGGLAGLGLGFATTRLAGRTALGAAKGLSGIGRGKGLMGPFRSPVARMATGTAKAGLGVTNFTLHNPRTAMLLGGSGLGLYALSQSGAGPVGSTESEMAQLSVKRGTSTGRQSLIESTQGLVQGLHQGRHR